MAWQVYRLVFRLETPLHVGRRGWGIIQRTRPYLMGKNLWAAATARLTRRLASEDYEAVGDALKKVIVFTYCYPATHPEEPLLPHYREQVGLCYDGLAAAEFEYRFVGSYASTAIDPAAQAAEEASLHEIEVLLPHTRGAGAPVYLCGYVLLRETATVLNRPITAATLFDLLSDVQVGGERGYGCGRLLLRQDESGPTEGPLFGRYGLAKTDADRPKLTVPNGSPLPAHALLPSLKAAGDIEPLTGREWGTFEDREGAGQKMPQGREVQVCYAPGSVPVFEENEEGKTFALLPGQYGIMQLAQ
jgi:hypothetical protein